MAVTVLTLGTESHIRAPDGVYLPPHTWKWLNQWWGLFHRVRYASRALPPGPPPEGWQKAPSHVEAAELYPVEPLPSFWQRRRLVRRRADKLLAGVGLVHIRGPFYEAYWTWQHAPQLPMVLEYHGDWVQTLAVQASESWLKRLTRPLRQRWVRQACQRLSRRALGIVAIGPDLADKYVPAAKPHLVTTNNTMLEQEYRRRASVELKSPPRLLVVGELVRHKGWQVLLAAVQQLRATIGRMEVAFVGDGPDRSLIEQSARATGLDGVLLLGRRAHGPALYAEYQRADAFVFPSLAGEGVPRVVHEAMALGCPVIATNNGSVGWQLRDGAGLLVPAGDPAALAAAIGRVLTDAALRRRLSDQGFARALEHTYEKQVAAIARFVRAVVPAGLLAPARSSQES